jgi:hypothetical protein
MKMFSLQDVTKNTFLSPFFCIDHEEAIELTQQALADTKHDSNNFQLHCLGTWDPDIGNFDTSKRCLVNLPSTCEA